MSKINEYRDFLRSVRSSLGYWKSYSLLQFTTGITRIMKAEKVSGKALGDLIKKSPQHVSQVLRGNENVTIEKMAEFAAALDSVVHIHVAKRGVLVRWEEVIQDKGAQRGNVTEKRSADEVIVQTDLPGYVVAGLGLKANTAATTVH